LVLNLSGAATGLLAVSLATANLLAYLMLVMIGVFLVTGPLIVYFYYRKSRKTRAVEPSTAT